MTKANMAVFKAKVSALIQTLHLSREEVLALVLGVAASNAATLSRLQLHGMLDAALSESGGSADAREAATIRMAEVARAAKLQGLDGLAALRNAFPGAPTEVLAGIWWEIEEQAAGTWWDGVATTIEGVAK